MSDELVASSSPARRHRLASASPAQRVAMPNPPPASLNGATDQQRAREGALHWTPARPGAQDVATAAASASTFTAGNWDAGNWDAGNRQDFEKWLQELARVETDPQLGCSLMEREPTVSCPRSPFLLQATRSHPGLHAFTGILQEYEHAFVEEGGYDDVQYLCGKSFTAVHDVAITCGIKEAKGDDDGGAVSQLDGAVDGVRGRHSGRELRGLPALRDLVGRPAGRDGQRHEGQGARHPGQRCVRVRGGGDVEAECPVCQEDVGPYVLLDFQRVMVACRDVCAACSVRPSNRPEVFVHRDEVLEWVMSVERTRRLLRECLRLREARRGF